MKNLSRTMLAVLAVGLLSCSFFCQQAEATQTFFYNNDFPNNLIGTASRPESAGKIEIESADDFLPTPNLTRITNATFTGLIPTGATIEAVRVEDLSRVSKRFQCWSHLRSTNI
jgi:hypothetical protein